MNDSAKPRLLFVYLKANSFVEEDLAFLNEHYDVRTFRFDAEKTSSVLGLLELWTRQLLWLLRELPEAELVFGWFADHHMALPVLMSRWFGVPAAVVLGGMDCNWVPELNYGVWDSRWRGPLVRWIVHRADLLPTVSPSLVEAEEQYSRWPERRRNGIEVHVPNLRTPHPVIRLGFDPDEWPMGPSTRSPVITTVAFIDSERTFRIKGIDLFLAAADRLPDATFQIVGISDRFAAALRENQDVSSNVELLSPRPRHELPHVYGQTSVYAQLSRVEAFGLVVGEAMLSGCVPVVSPVGQLPELVGEAGWIVDRPDPDEIASTLRQALDSNPAARQGARAHISEHFSWARRREHLLRVLEELRD